MRLGLVSDTHGLVRPAALDALRGSDAIVHAGDIGTPAVLAALAAIAPVHAIRGNNDPAALFPALPERLDLELGGLALHVVHDRNALPRDFDAGRYDLVVSGHSHRASVERVTHDSSRATWFVNPGSAGPRRFSLPVTIARLDTARRPLAPAIVMLAIDAGTPRAPVRRRRT